jgi:hypothetical protein
MTATAVAIDLARDFFELAFADDQSRSPYMDSSRLPTAFSI